MAFILIKWEVLGSGGCLWLKNAKLQHRHPAAALLRGPVALPSYAAVCRRSGCVTAPRARARSQSEAVVGSLTQSGGSCWSVRGANGCMWLGRFGPPAPYREELANDPATRDALPETCSLLLMFEK